jgi:hypothetical protein
MVTDQLEDLSALVASAKMQLAPEASKMGPTKAVIMRTTCDARIIS